MKEIEKAIADIEAGYHTDFTNKMSLQALHEKLENTQPCRGCIYFDTPDNECAPCQSCKRMVRVNDCFKLKEDDEK